MTGIQSALFAMQDKTYREFHCPLIPNVEPKNVIGVRFPQLRKYAKEIFGTNEAEKFLQKLPHKYYDENNLHAYLIEQIRDFDICVKAVDEFLPFVDNWATCDTLRPKVFKKHKAELLVWIKKWIKSSSVYAVRFGIGMLMCHFLDEDFSEKYLAVVAAIRTPILNSEESCNFRTVQNAAPNGDAVDGAVCEENCRSKQTRYLCGCFEHSGEYYIKMMQAWYFATALTKQYDAALPFIEQKKLEAWTHNKAIQKACESHAIPAERKAVLRGMRVSQS